MRAPILLILATVILPACRQATVDGAPQSTTVSVAPKVASSAESSARPTPSIDAPTPIVASRDAGAEMPPLAGAEWLERLELHSGKVAYVTPPLGAPGPRPIVFAVHGIWDRAEWACGGWRLGSSNFAFVLCPQGDPANGDRFGWKSATEIEQVVDEAVSALKDRFREYVIDTDMIYAGFSQGAYLARSVLLADPRRFPDAVFAEGGYDTLEDPEFARRFKAGGGRRILVICGGAGCFARAAHARTILKRYGLQVFVGGDEAAGHNLNAQMQSALRKAWPEFVADEPSWRGFLGSTP